MQRNGRLSRKGVTVLHAIDRFGGKQQSFSRVILRNVLCTPINVCVHTYRSQCTVFTFVGNLPWTVMDADLATHFNSFEPYDAHVTRMTGRYGNLANPRLRDPVMVVTRMTGRYGDLANPRLRDPVMGRKAIAEMTEMTGYVINERAIVAREDRDVSGEGNVPSARGSGNLERGNTRANGGR